MLPRRTALALGAASALGLGRARADTVVLPFGNGERPLVRFPEKRPLIAHTVRPPQLETPLAVFNDGLLTPADAFYVHYHLPYLPLDIDLDTYRLEVKGHVEDLLYLSLDELKALGRTELVAVCQCAGNSRGFSAPRVAGIQAGHGMMGNARWEGVPLRAVLEKAGVKPGAMQVRFDALDSPAMDGTADYVKALALDHASDGEVMLAWGMNGAELPFLNGFPLRLVVPGYFGTYWVKHVNEITVLDEPLDQFWTSSAYRLPDTDCTCIPPGTRPEHTRAIGRYKVRSLFTSVAPGATLPAGREITLAGVAFDGGSGIHRVEVSLDDGRTWREARLGQDLGRYSFRRWRLPVTLAAGEHVLKVHATANSGETQPEGQPWNPGGYQRNVVEAVTVGAA